jgi:carbamoyl-phosphate synthase
VYRIGNSVEFDYSAVLVTREMRRRGHKVLLINNNPETVSTDYDECDRLYFEELSLETILDILHKERITGVILSVGGQIAQNMALGLKSHNVKIFGTDASDIDRAEDRNKFSQLCDDLKIDQPVWASLNTTDDAHAFCKKVGFPVLVRPSYVLSGSAMAVIWSDLDVERYLTSAAKVSGKHPVVISKYHTKAMEFDVDVVAHNGNVICYAVCEHIENAGVHSGDATMFLPPQKVKRDTVDALILQAKKIASALKVTGPMNVQFLLTADNAIKVIEANVRSSRSIPFVSKVTRISFPEMMVTAFLTPLTTAVTPLQQDLMSQSFVGCKASMFSFIRLACADPILGVEMASTGEVGVFGKDKHDVLFKALAAQNFKIPKSGNVLVSVDTEDERQELAPFIKLLSAKLNVLATKATAAVLKSHGVESTLVHLPNETGAEPNIRTMLTDKKIGLVIQIRDKANDFMLRRMKQSEAPQDYWIRRLSVDFAASVITEIEIAKLFCEAFSKYTAETVEIEPHSHYKK